ncbi:MAG: hypothetical protein LUI04_03525, partial [Porphyromonadaceae bacterium]|nr:hypothetical protein [Porphyromonadaceae bacterium]
PKTLKKLLDTSLPASGRGLILYISNNYRKLSVKMIIENCLQKVFYRKLFASLFIASYRQGSIDGG